MILHNKCEHIAQKTARIYIIHFSLKDVYRNLLNLQN